MSVTLSKEFIPKNLIVGKASSKNGGAVKSARVSYVLPDGSTDKLILQTARMKVPFGLSNDEKFGNGTKWDIRLSFQGEDNDSKIKRFRECAEALDTRIVETALENCKDWLDDDDHDMKTLRKAYKNPIKKSKKAEYSDMYRISVPFNRENTAPQSSVEFFDDKGEPVSWKEIKPGCSMICLFEVNGVWISKGMNQFGLSVRLLQAQIFQTKKLSGFQIRNDSDASANEYSEDSDVAVEEPESEEEEDYN